MNKFVTQKGKLMKASLALALSSTMLLQGCAADTGTKQASSVTEVNENSETPLTAGTQNDDTVTDIVELQEDTDDITTVENNTPGKKNTAKKNHANENAPGQSTGHNGSAANENSSGKKTTPASNSNAGKSNKPGSNPGSNPGPSAPATDLSMDGYTLMWEDEFNGTQLDRTSWNVELHNPGWVNSELQAYVDSTDNIEVADGYLTIRPVREVDSEGNVSYTSGRINTQNKNNFTYGMFQCRAKVPSGQGFLPAFWLMAADENIYGQWPRCGEIDCMEVMGQDTSLAYGTIHYGNNHQESQGTYRLTGDDSFSDEFHVFTCEWEPGSIKWYVDGYLYHEESDWYSTTIGQETITYPAPFDQPFYIILNLAVGGSWVGNPDETTVFENNNYVVDYVKVYQKDSYDENVSRPVKTVNLRQPDGNGNYANNGAFSVAESLTDDTNWKFMTALGGIATATINDSMIINTENEGTVDYSVQLVQADLPFAKGATYRISFDAYTSDVNGRTMKVAVKAPDHGYSEYMSSKTVSLGNEMQTYTYDFKMTSDDDANGRLEFNMGAAGSTATIYIDNVKVTKIADPDPNAVEDKVIRADGNYLYNGKFQSGDGHLGDWEITNLCDATVKVTTLTDGRRLMAVSNGATALSDLVLAQKDLPFTSGAPYYLSFDAEVEEDTTITVHVGGVDYSVDLTAGAGTYGIKLPSSNVYTNSDVSLDIAVNGTILLDNIYLVEDAMIKNGSFDAGTSGYEIYVDGSASASYVVDSLTENNALDFTVNNTSDQDWKIQIKQNDVLLEKGKWYKLTFEAKSDLSREIRVIMQGKEDKGWAVYSSDNVVSLTPEFVTYTDVFQMTNTTDEAAFLSICLGKVGTDAITQQHRVVIDNITLEEVDAPELPEESESGDEDSIPVADYGENFLVNPTFTNNASGWESTIANWGGDATASATSEIVDDKYIFHIEDPGNQDWHVQLKQTGLPIKAEETYTVSYTIESSVARNYLAGVQDATEYTYIAGPASEDLLLEADVPKTVSYTFTASENYSNAAIYFSVGETAADSPAGDITISDVSIVRVEN